MSWPEDANFDTLFWRYDVARATRRGVVHHVQETLSSAEVAYGFLQACRKIPVKPYLHYSLLYPFELVFHELYHSALRNVDV